MNRLFYLTLVCIISSTMLFVSCSKKADAVASPAGTTTSTTSTTNGLANNTYVMFGRTHKPSLIYAYTVAATSNLGAYYFVNGSNNSDTSSCCVYLPVIPTTTTTYTCVPKMKNSGNPIDAGTAYISFNISDKGSYKMRTSQSGTVTATIVGGKVMFNLLMFHLPRRELPPQQLMGLGI